MIAVSYTATGMLKKEGKASVPLKKKVKKSSVVAFLVPLRAIGKALLCSF